jgi:hypothetical protein
MHPRTREVRAPESGIDPRGSGSGQPPLLQGFLKRRKGQRPAATATAATPEGTPTATAAADRHAAPADTEAEATSPRPEPSRGTLPAPKRARQAPPKG